ncbi:putative indole-3-pyruvate monooxygenase [Fulvia fulva]|uniref:Indole-3-pyruvate monooxygenase n=1 Tax=Passalora fulva TaxID=5499 RepID=A0A9Q8PD39_PASFU|nr:putative indole-3-pyruvate monooxygenase [Fulvia fulva]KAK4620539.1 putative indole-3-pyruvate monooxygenase [Fulvia fulva]UJO20225.1 putative indole-3-pyruvate monooxygenase [Fulvia fulva]WPV32632.1 putative indole-3-pyruvate monooxygenase [Fulvia fulva]
MAAVILPKSPHDITLPHFGGASPTVSPQKVEQPYEIAQKWLTSFEQVLANQDAIKLGPLLHEDSWWRDHLALSWDLRTIRGSSQILDFVSPLLENAGLHNFHLQENGKFAPHKDQPIPELEWIEFMFSFDTSVGHGKGMVRLATSPSNVWKAHMIHTSLQALRDFPELKGDLRPHGGTNSLKGGVAEGNWYERRQRQKKFLDDEPEVLIVGAGQSGLNLGARLQALGLSVLILDKNERVGDNWRHRYRTLVTHDPVQYTPMAYMKFPENWPLFTPKDKLADWFELYASAMELNIWLRSTVRSAEYNEGSQSWSADVLRADGSHRSMKPKHIVMCTGHAGEAYIPKFPGHELFEGAVYHGSQHKDATFQDNIAGKKVVVLQRKGTYVISAKQGLFMLHEGMYDEHSPPTKDADVAGQSLPIPVQFALNIGLTESIKTVEKSNIDGLTKAGFKLDFGHDGSGIYRKYIEIGGGYYIDVGCSQLIIDGKVKVEQSPEGIKGFSERALVLADGRELEADVVVLATGYDNMRTTVRKILGDRIADRCKDVWNLDAEGEVNAMWRPSGHPKLWFMGGSLALCRIYSRHLALQIKASIEGLV